MSLKITNFSVTKSNSFAEISPKGLFLYNSPSEYIKFGTGTAEIKTSLLKVGDLVVYGNLHVYGEQITSGAVGEILGTTSNTFTIGNSTTSGDTILKFGSYITDNKLTANGSSITSSVFLSAPDFKKAGNSLFSIITAELKTLDSGLASTIPIEIPNGKTYIINTNTLLVFVDGVMRYKGVSEDYMEISTNSIAFNYDLAEGAKILFLIIG